MRATILREVSLGRCLISSQAARSRKTSYTEIALVQEVFQLRELKGALSHLLEFPEVLCVLEAIKHLAVDFDVQYHSSRFAIAHYDLRRFSLGSHLFTLMPAGHTLYYNMPGCPPSNLDS